MMGFILARLSLLMKTIAIGLGNPILGDDSVGWKAAEVVKKQLNSPPAPLLKRGGSEVDVDFLSLGGISRMEHLISYERAILVDAAISDQEIGSIVVVRPDEMPDYSALHTTSTHDTSMQNALKLGKAMGANLPEDVIVLGIATDHIHDFSEELSPPVANAVLEAAKIVLDLLGQ
jgi:hydrogenase maturation protease